MRTVCTVTAGFAAAIALGAWAAPASADAGSNASCLGIEASSLSPPGSSSEVAGGMSELSAIIREAFPGPPGATFSRFAQLREGSHEACDEAFGE
jgi:hypothetical protein